MAKAKNDARFRTSYGQDFEGVIDLDKLSKRKDADFLLKYGEAEIIIQYRVENATRPGHPFIDLVVGQGDPAMTVDLVDKDGSSIRTGDDNDEEPVVQILLGQNVAESCLVTKTISASLFGYTATLLAGSRNVVGICDASGKLVGTGTWEDPCIVGCNAVLSTPGYSSQIIYEYLGEALQNAIQEARLPD